MKIILSENCNCPKDAIYHMDESKAIAAYIKCLQEDVDGGRMYWAVHLNGKHILHIEEENAEE